MCTECQRHVCSWLLQDNYPAVQHADSVQPYCMPQSAVLLSSVTSPSTPHLLEWCGVLVHVQVLDRAGCAHGAAEGADGCEQGVKLAAQLQGVEVTGQQLPGGTHLHKSDVDSSKRSQDESTRGHVQPKGQKARTLEQDLHP